MLIAVAAPACSSSAPTTSRPTNATPAGPTAKACPSAAPAHFRWPTPIPPGTPRPDGATLGDRKQLPVGATVVEVDVPDGLKAQITFVERTFPAAGYQLLRGDAEQDEADIPFRHGTLAGRLRLQGDEPCRTKWILTVIPPKKSNS